MNIKNIQQCSLDSNFARCLLACTLHAALNQDVSLGFVHVYGVKVNYTCSLPRLPLNTLDKIMDMFTCMHACLYIMCICVCIDVSVHCSISCIYFPLTQFCEVVLLNVFFAVCVCLLAVVMSFMLHLQCCSVY